MSNIANVLLGLRTPQQVEQFLGDLLKNGGYKWVPVGEEISNARSIEVAREGSSPAIERITNAIDGVLELQQGLNGDQPAPPSPRECLKRWYGAVDGHVSSLDEGSRQIIADNISLILEDSETYNFPTLIIRDRGIGQHPDDFASTLLKLGQSNKISKHFLCGTYGQGGASTYAWCDYTVIISRRHPNLLNRRHDEVGWTIVRYDDSQVDPETGVPLKIGVYLYLVNEDGSIPRFDPSFLPQDFGYGTYIAHIRYELGRYGARMTLVGYRFLNSLLFDPILPFWVDDRRYNERRVIPGNLSRLKDSGHVEYMNVYEVKNPDLGSLRIRYWVMKAKPKEPDERRSYYLDSYVEHERSPNNIIITHNGQRHAAIQKSFIKQELNLSFLSNYLLVQVECDNLSLPMKRKLFVSTREFIREGEERMEIIRNEIKTALLSDPEIARLEEIRRRQHLVATDEISQSRIRRVLDRLITAGFRQISGEIGEGVGEPEPLEYEPNDPPTFLKIATPGNPLKFMIDSDEEVLVKCDGPDDLLTRSVNKGILTTEISGQTQATVIGHTPMYSGRFKLRIRVPSQATVDATGRLHCRLEIPGVVNLSDARDCAIVGPPPPPPIHDPPTIFRIKGSDPLSFKLGKRSFATIECDGPDGLLMRAENPAQLIASFQRRTGLIIIGRSDLRRGRIRVYIEVPDHLEPGTEDELECRLQLADGSMLGDIRRCIIVRPPSAGRAGRERTQQVPNYEIRQVWRNDENWNEFSWDESDVGKFDKSGELLILFVSMEHEPFANEIGRVRTLSPDRMETFRDRYTALIGYHLWLQYQAQESGAPLEEEAQKRELQRVVKTVLLSARPEREFD